MLRGPRMGAGSKRREAVATAAERLGQMGGWNVGPDVEQEVFRADEYREHAQPGAVIFQDRPG